MMGNSSNIFETVTVSVAVYDRLVECRTRLEIMRRILNEQAAYVSPEIMRIVADCDPLEVVDDLDAILKFDEETAS